MLYGQTESVFILEQLAEQEGKLSEWEQGFVQSLTEQVGNGRKLSIKQRETLSNIWDKVGA